jgi:hypothetical protein
METIHLNVDSLQASQRHALESVVGRPLQPSQRVVIQILDSVPVVASTGNSANGTALPAWCNVLEGLTPEESAALDESLASRTASRPS